jgi:hypothetical protein
MFIVDKEKVLLVKGRMVGEASTMGLAPGEWPDLIGVLDDKEGFLFTRVSFLAGGQGELVGCSYRSTCGLMMTVIND